MNTWKKSLFLGVALAPALLAGAGAEAAMLTFNSTTPANNATTRASWLTAAGISSPDYLVDFETGFANGDNVHGVSGLFPGGLVLLDNSNTGPNPSPAVIIRSGAGSINGSNPVGVFAATHDEAAYLWLDFSAQPVDYVAFMDIDHAGTSGVAFFSGGSSATFSLETTGGSGNSAEFFGLYRNDQPAIVALRLDSSGDGRWGVDNIEYGPAPVPLPAALPLLASGLAGLAGLRRWRRQG
ncbi:MAG: VPLPA-CTERM sorting domain-containing protein [Thermodesulfobacteriota bacterium]